MSLIEKAHHSEAVWQVLLTRIRAEMTLRGAHPSRTVVLVPYAQLMNEGRSAWQKGGPNACFVPRFETTQNWASAQRAVGHEVGDIHRDTGMDLLTAGQLLARAGLKDQQDALAPRLVEAAWSLTGVASAIHPEQRAAWGAQLSGEFGAAMDSPILALEAAISRIALAWAASSGYASDVLFTERPDLLVVLSGFQVDPLGQALLVGIGERGLGLSFISSPLTTQPASRMGSLTLYQREDAQDEAQSAAACVLAHLNEGRAPIALVAIDRMLTRRIRAMLGERGVQVRDETGWKLSTTRAAATLMGLLRACRFDASTDDVLDWLKHWPNIDAFALASAEAVWRKEGVREWQRALHALPGSAAPARALVAQADALRNTLTHGRSLSDWLSHLRTALQECGQWSGLTADTAGQAVVKTLRLGAGSEDDFAAFTGQMSLAALTTWVTSALEAASFNPTHPAQEQVVILPLSQLLGRSFRAVVLPGCDEGSLTMASEPPGQWTTAQRQLLGLPSREVLANATRDAWQNALHSPHVDLMWRTSEAGEHLMPSPLVQTLLLKDSYELGHDPRALRQIAPQPQSMPQPRADALAVRRLSSSAYEDLRRCPYRFFALRQLKLQEMDELDASLSKRDFGNWLHGLLKLFHDDLRAVPTPDRQAREALIDGAAARATQQLGLSDAEFMPFAASWPRVREGYLTWLAEHEQKGAVYAEGEVWSEMPLGSLTLVGKIDRIDQLPAP
jgi:ATP-dependent helicase/nuclease subunit B